LKTLSTDCKMGKREILLCLNLTLYIYIYIYIYIYTRRTEVKSHALLISTQVGDKRSATISDDIVTKNKCSYPLRGYVISVVGLYAAMMKLILDPTENLQSNI
jgi:hypothetical protein